MGKSEFSEDMGSLSDSSSEGSRRSAYTTEAEDLSRRLGAVEETLNQLTLKVDKIYVATVTLGLATKDSVHAEVAVLKSDLLGRIKQRPKKAAIFLIVGFFAIVASLPFWQQWIALFNLIFNRT